METDPLIGYTVYLNDTDEPFPWIGTVVGRHPRSPGRVRVKWDESGRTDVVEIRHLTVWPLTGRQDTQLRAA